MIGSTRVLSRIPAGARGSWARTLDAGQRVVAHIQMHDLKVFDDSGQLIKGVHHRVASHA